MMKPISQLAFDLTPKPRFGVEDFLVSPSNEKAYAYIEQWPDWNDSVLCLMGPEGSGKSHLAHIWADIAHAWIVEASDLTDERIVHLVSNGALVVENVHMPSRHEAALFHLLNMAREKRCSVLLTGEHPPQHWNIQIPDLLSRLRLAPSVALEAPDDALLKSVLVKLFLDRQLVVDTGVIDYLILRIERSFKAAIDCIKRLDEEALKRKKRLSRSFVAEIFKD